MKRSRLDLVPREIRDEIYWWFGLGTRSSTITYASAAAQLRHFFFLVEDMKPMMRHCMKHDMADLETICALMRTKSLFRDEIAELMFEHSALIIEVRENLYVGISKSWMVTFLDMN